MQAVTITQITPSELEILIENSLKKILGSLNTRSTPPEDDFLNIDEAAEFLNLEKATLYGMTSRRQIPHFKKSKKLYFSRKELTAWLGGSSRKVKPAVA